MADRDTSRAVCLFEERYGVLHPGSDLSRLTELLRSFSLLPYENLSKILAWSGGQQRDALRLPLRVMEDHLRFGTGGTCFSLTELLRHLVCAAGFSCHPVMAHMRHGPDIHCALRVDAGGEAWLVDPGYLVKQPLCLSASPVDLRGAQPGQPLVVRAGTLGPIPEGVPRGDFDLFTLEPEGPRWRYRFSDRAPTHEEFLGHWQRSFHQPAMRSLLVTHRSEEGRLLYLHNHKLRAIDPEHKTTRNVRADLERSVHDLFGIDPEITRRALSLLRAQREEWRLAPDASAARRGASSPGERRR